MPSEAEQPKLTLAEFVSSFRHEMTPLNPRFSYFSTVPVAEEDLRQYVNDPIAALSPAIAALLPPIGIVLAPFIEKGNGKDSDALSFTRPTDPRYVPRARQDVKGWVFLGLGIKDLDVADYHYHLYNGFAEVLSERWPQGVEERFSGAIREELGSSVHGEVDERSWRLKQALLRRQANVRKETKLFREYARQAFEDTVTLYMHGTCCDIDVETGPRQMASRHLRRRLELLTTLFPPPEGYAVLPEQLKTR